MTTFTYTGTLTDIGLGALTAALPVMRVRPKVEAFGPDGLVSAIPVPVTLNPTTGAFSMTLIPSGELTPSRGGSPGVPYVIEVGRFEATIDGTTTFHGADIYEFVAVAGGGNIGGMAGASLLAVWQGPPWPAEPYPKGFYIDIVSGEWTIVA
jgi:hypothetical protein